MNGESGYIELLRKILEKGELRQERTGTGTLSLFGEQLRFDLSNERVPLLTTKFVPYKACIKELLWFLSGCTDVRKLRDQGVHIWDGNSSREYLDAVGLSDLPEFDIGAGYGFQWRHFGAEYINCLQEYDGQGVDQIEYVINEIKTNPTSRRIFMSAWNPSALKRMALPPCHVSCQFYVSGDSQLSCHLYQRSVDCGLGLPFNIFSYAVLTRVIAMKTGLQAKELVISTGDTHIYTTHVDALRQQIEREPRSQPLLRIDDTVVSKDWTQITIDDFTLSEYNYHPVIKMSMSV